MIVIQVRLVLWYVATHEVNEKTQWMCGTLPSYTPFCYLSLLPNMPHLSAAEDQYHDLELMLVHREGE